MKNKITLILGIIFALTIVLMMPQTVEAKSSKKAKASKWKAAYAATAQEYYQKHHRSRGLWANNDKYMLAYIDADAIPELICTDYGYSTCVYTYYKGKVVFLKQYSYGAGGVYCPTYANKKNSILQLDVDGAGLKKYYTYSSIKKGKIVNGSKNKLSTSKYKQLVGNMDYNKFVTTKLGVKLAK